MKGQFKFPFSVEVKSRWCVVADGDDLSLVQENEVTNQYVLETVSTYDDAVFCLKSILRSINQLNSAWE